MAGGAGVCSTGCSVGARRRLAGGFWQRGFFLCGCRQGRRAPSGAGFLDGRNEFADFHLLAFGGFDAEHAGFFSGDFGRDFVGFQRQQNVAGLDVVAVFLVPGGDDAAGDRLADGGNDDIHDRTRFTG